MTKTRLAPPIFPFDCMYAIWFFTFCSQPTGCAVVQIKPLILGSMIIIYVFLFLVYCLWFLV
jgi:hypothetical protein